MNVDNKKIIRRITLRSLSENRAHTLFTILAITLSSAMISALCGFAASGRRMLFELMGPNIFDTQNLSLTVYTLAAVFGGIIVITSVIIASNAFRVSAGERTKQFGLLKTIGATKKQITASVVYEGLFLCAVGIPLGLLLGNMIHFAGASVMETLFAKVNAAGIVKSVAGLHFEYVFSYAATGLAILVSLSTVLFSAWLPARKVARISAIDAIRQSGETEFAVKSTKTSPLIHRLFGYEGALAVKYVKRGKRSHRATTSALCISIIVFMSMAFFENCMNTVMSGNWDYGSEATAAAVYTSTAEYRLTSETVELITNGLMGSRHEIGAGEGQDGGVFTSHWTYSGQDAAGFMSRAKTVLEDVIGVPQNGEYNIAVFDKFMYMAGERSITFAVRVFVFGFIFMLTLIAVTNIFSTIITNMRLRNHEFALLRSVGMAKRNFKKMFFCENIFSFIRAMLFGIPLGSATVFTIWLSFAQSGWFKFEYPWLEAVISAAGIYVIVFAATKIAERKINALSVIDALRE